MLRYLPALVLTSSVTAASACGYCVEDKIAAVYDHAAVSRALQENRTVVFFAIDGALRTGEAEKRKLEGIVASVPGVDRQSVRLSIELATLALAFDPRRANLGQVQNVLDRKLAALGLSLLAMRVMDKPGDLAAVRRR